MLKVSEMSAFSTKQKHNLDKGSDPLSVWNFCDRSSEPHFRPEGMRGLLASLTFGCLFLRLGYTKTRSKEHFFLLLIRLLLLEHRYRCSFKLLVLLETHDLCVFPVLIIYLLFPYFYLEILLAATEAENKT